MMLCKKVVNNLRKQHGFKGVTLGPRILKTTEALISMVALVYDAL